MTMFSFGTTLPSMDEGLFTSASAILAGGGTLPTSFIVAPVTVIEKVTCAFCENLLQPSHSGPKVGDHKQLEDLALEHFTRKILGAEEESLQDVSEIFPDDLDRTRYKRLLTSVKLCEGCIFHFAKCEETLLKDQMAYIGNMSGMRDYCEVLQDPWLDLKRLAYTKLKAREGTIKEKLQLMSRVFPSNQGALKIIFTTTPPSSSTTPRGAQSGYGPSTSTPLTTATATTTAQQLLVTSIGNLPVVSHCSTSGVVSMDISEVMNQEQQEQQQSATCQFAVASDKGSISSSCAASPNHDEGKEMENSQDSTQSGRDQEVDDFINVQPDRNQGSSQEEESKTEDREPAAVDLEDQESSNALDSQDKNEKSKGADDAEYEEGADLSMDDTTDQQENQSQEVHEPEKNIKKRTADDAKKNTKVSAPITTQEMLDVLETSDKEENEEEEEDDADNDDVDESQERTDTGRATPDVQCQKVVVCLDKLDPSKTPVKVTPAKNSPVLKTPPKSKPQAPSKSKTPVVTPSKSKTPSVTPSKSKTPSVTPSKSKTPSEAPSKNKSGRNRAPSESSSCSSTKSLSRKSSSAMPLSKKTASIKPITKDSTTKTSSKTISSEKTSMNPPPARTSNSKPPRRGSVTPTPSDDEGTSSKSRGKKRPYGAIEASEKVFGSKKLRDMVRSSPREYFTPPESKKDKKKVFKIGNRYLTESSSSDENDSDKDSDVHFTDCTAADADSDF